MNNNRNNNRRRGRGNRPQGGGNPVNRIDSRARGNAPQMLEKYRKLAQDAQHNGDRVQAEYYLQFADHYHRVMVDTRQRQEEGRPRRDDGREQQRQPAADEFDRDEDGADGREDASEDRFAPRHGDERQHERQGQRQNERQNDRARFADRRPGREHPDGDEQEAPLPVARPDGEPDSFGEQADDQAPRRGRAQNGAGQREPRVRANGGGRGERPARSHGANGAPDMPGIDAAALPPAFNPVEQVEGEPIALAPPRRRRAKPAANEGDAPAIVNG